MNTFIRSFVPFYSISILSTPSVPSFNGSNPSTNNPAFKEYYYLTLRKDAEAQSGLSPCFDITGFKTVTFPELTFQFKGGAQMTQPLVNYFSLVRDSEVVCLTVVSNGGIGPAITSGPAIILGNYQQQNFYIEYDLENERFGFGPRSFKRKA
ncbi:hypothetical protein JHK87_007864 [Glycine soja]|nr:hypothetical protein JHK87_007864 [Glycine soja]